MSRLLGKALTMHHKIINLLIFDNSKSFTEGKDLDLEQVRLWDHLPSSLACRHGRGGERKKKDKPQEQPEEKDTEG